MTQLDPSLNEWHKLHEATIHIKEIAPWQWMAETDLVRVPKQAVGDLVWEDEIMRVLPPEPEGIPVMMDPEALEYVKQLPRGEHTIEVDLRLFPIEIQERGERPYMPHMLLMVESESGFILNNELLGPETGLPEMWGAIPMRVAHQLARMGTRPREIRARTFELFTLIQLLAQELDFEVKQSPRLRSLERARDALMRRFG